MRFAHTVATVLVATTLPALAVASPLTARVSTSGLNFMRDRALELVPSRIDLPPFKVDMFDCDPEPAYFELTGARVNVTVQNLSLSLPSSGTIRADVTLTVAASGQAHFEHLWACYGRETCDASVEVKNARAIIDLAPSIDAQGKPRIVLSKVDVQLAPSDVSLALSNCPADDVVNLIVGFVKDFGLQLGVVIGQEIARKEVGPMLEGLLAGFLSYEGNGGMFSPDVHFIDFKAALTGIDINAAGLTVSGDLDLTSKFPPAACVSNDPGDPSVFAGPAPDLGAGAASDVAVAVNLGLIQDVLYHAWHEGLMCVTPDTLKELGIEIDSALGHVNDLLPGFPDGTTFSFEAQVGEPPRVEGNVATSAKLGIHVNRMAAKLIATLPDRSSRILSLDLDATASASMVMDPRINALALQVDGVKLNRLDVDDQLGLTAMGFDFARVRQLLETAVLPRMLGELGQIPVTGPVFGGFGGMPIYVILKELKTTPAYVAVKANLFKAPDDDTEAPTTQIIDKPSRVVKPSEARLMFGGADKQIPVELLRYRVIVSGKAAEPTFVKVLSVGEEGTSGKVRVEVHAVDLAGNEDPAGQVVEVDVDGVLPTLGLTAQLRGAVDDLTPTLKWTASDDRTAAAKIGARVEVTELPARAGEGAEVEVSARDLPGGTTETTLEGLSAGKQYRVVLTVLDEAGNQAATTVIFSVSPDAAGGGCEVGGGTDGWFATLVLLAFVALVMSRRRVPECER